MLRRFLISLSPGFVAAALACTPSSTLAPSAAEPRAGWVATDRSLGLPVVRSLALTVSDLGYRFASLVEDRDGHYLQLLQR